MEIKEQKKRKRQQTTKQERELTELLFGKNILQEDESKTNTKNKDVSLGQTEAPESGSTAVWKDEECDFELKHDRLKKLSKKAELKTNTVSGETYSTLLKDRFQQKKVAWANVQPEDESHEKDDLGILSSSQSLVRRSGKGTVDPSRSSQSQGITMLRQIDANVDGPSSKEINCVRFHSNGSLLLVGGEDKTLRFFRLDGEKNETQLTVRFNDMAIKAAEFVGDPTSGEVIIGGRRPHFYTYDTMSGNTMRIPGILRNNMTSHELMAVSPPDSTGNSARGFVAFAGLSGYIHILSSKQKTWVADLKMASDQHVKALCWWNDHVICGSGGGGNVCLWDLRMSGSGTPRVLSSFRHDDGTYTSSLATVRYGNSAQHLAVGAESGVVSIYDMENLSTGSSSFEPTKLKSVFNLTTKVTSMSMHPTGQLLAIGSDQQKDQLRMVHLPSCNAYSNWPTKRTPLGRVRCVDFSPAGEHFVQGDHRGQVHHYMLDPSHHLS